METPRQGARAHAGCTALACPRWTDEDGRITEHTGGGNLRVKVEGQSGDRGDGRVNRPPGGEGMADQRREQMLQAALKVIVERGYADTRGSRWPEDASRTCTGSGRSRRPVRA
jgi:hypothetical protein